MASQKVVEWLNEEFGKDVSSITKARNLHKELSANQRELENKLYVKPNDVSSIGSSVFFKKLEEGYEAVERSRNVITSFQNIKHEATKHLQKVSDLQESFKVYILEFQELTAAENYLMWISQIEEKNEQVQEAVEQGEDKQAVPHLSWLINIWCQLQTSSCKTLLNFVQKTIIHWYNLLRERFGKEFEKTLQVLQWPISSTSTFTTPSVETLQRFESLFLSLIQIQLPEEILRQTNEKRDNKTSVSLILPLELMIQPLRKRFAFHFMSNRQTNRLDKPEWYLTQVLSWIHDHGKFMDHFVQAILNKSGFQSIQAKMEVMHALVELAAKKLEEDISELLFDDLLFTHTIDEVLLFEKEILSRGYPQSYPSILSVLLSEKCFNRWINLERHYAMTKVDELLNSHTAWQVCVQDVELDEMKTPECAEAFMTLLSAMTERYQNLRDIHNQLQFLDLQLELLDDFRMRLLQLRSQAQDPLDSSFCPILNTVHYLIVVLKEWSNLPFFIQLLYHKVQEENQGKWSSALKDSSFSEPPGKKMNWNSEDMQYERFLHYSVFDYIVLLLQQMQEDLVTKVIEWVLLDVKAKSRPYRKDKWFSMPLLPHGAEYSVSPTAYSMLSVLKSHIQVLQESLAQPLFKTVWQRVCKGLNIYLYEEVILQNYFSEGGGEQLKWDMTRNLFPIFGRFTQKPENYFKEVKEACKLLTLPRASALLLLDTLNPIQSELVDVTAALEEQGIFSLSLNQALKILLLRSDLANA